MISGNMLLYKNFLIIQYVIIRDQGYGILEQQQHHSCQVPTSESESLSTLFDPGKTYEGFKRKALMVGVPSSS